MLSPNAVMTLEKRYFLKDSTGQLIETTPEFFHRIAAALASSRGRYNATPEQIEAETIKFERLLYNPDFDSPDFLPNSPTLMNAGTELGMLSACFVLPVPDDIAGIFDALKHQALIHQSGGGTGFDYSELRPENDFVQSTQGVASGPLSFARIFDCATEQIKQGGKRRGANMAIMRVDHPDILKFLVCKDDKTQMTNFNISVSLSDEFMQAVAQNRTYNLINPRSGLPAGALDARMVLRKVAEHAHGTGEPGLVFMDRMNRYCPVPWLGKYAATNPCGEQPLLPYESCNLGSINLENFVVKNSVKCYNVVGYEMEIDWQRLRSVVYDSIDMLDCVIDANKFPIPELKAMSDATRKIGLGVMGFARMLFKLGLRYGSDESLVVAGRVMSFIDYHSKIRSVELAMQHGPFPAMVGHEAEFGAYFSRVCAERQAAPNKHPDCNYQLLDQLVAAHGIRHSNTDTVAPTGTLSLIADTSGGCEPVFALAFKRWQMQTHMIDSDKVLAAKMREDGVPETVIEEIYTELTREVQQGDRMVSVYHGSLVEVAAGLDPHSAVAMVAAHYARVFTTAHDTTPAEHVRMQAAFQAFNDSAISKTINLPETATVDDVADAYALAYELGCKGITVYRNNCRDFQPLSTGNSAVAPALPDSNCVECVEGACPLPAVIHVELDVVLTATVPQTEDSPLGLAQLQELADNPPQ